MKRIYFAPAIVLALLLSACTRSTADLFSGGGAVPGATEAARVLPFATETPVVEPTATMVTPTPSGGPTCFIDVGDPSIWVEGGSVLFEVTISDGSGLPAIFSSDNGLSGTVDELSKKIFYENLKMVPSPHRVLILTLATGATCTAEVDIIPAAVATSNAAATLSLVTETPTLEPTATLAPTESPTPTSDVSLTPTETATIPPAPTATPGLPPETGDGDNQRPKSPLEILLDLLNWLLGN